MVLFNDFDLFHLRENLLDDRHLFVHLILLAYGAVRSFCTDDLNLRDNPFDMGCQKFSSQHHQSFLEIC